MITDQETNFLYLSQKLEDKKYSAFTEDFCELLKEKNIRFEYLKNTNDIWCRDYMPVQISEEKFVLFDYHPSYLNGLPHLITNAEPICQELGIHIEKSKIKLDGGNVVKSKNKAIMSEVVFSENPDYTEEELKNELKRLLEVEEICFIPRLPYDDLSHADGVVRLLDENTVLVNRLKGTKESDTFTKALFGKLGQYGFNAVQIPYYPDYKKTKDGLNTATGCYMNYLQVGHIVFLPFYGNEQQDQEALKVFERYFRNVFPVDARIIAENGGVLNCISWNIKKSNMGKIISMQKKSMSTKQVERYRKEVEDTIDFLEETKHGIYEQMINIASTGVWRGWSDDLADGTSFCFTPDILTDTGDRKIDVLWELYDKLLEVKQRFEEIKGSSFE